MCVDASNPRHMCTPPKNTYHAKRAHTTTQHIHKACLISISTDVPIVCVLSHLCEETAGAGASFRGLILTIDVMPWCCAVSALVVAVHRMPRRHINSHINPHKITRAHTNRFFEDGLRVLCVWCACVCGVCVSTCESVSICLCVLCGCMCVFACVCMRCTVFVCAVYVCVCVCKPRV